MINTIAQQLPAKGVREDEVLHFVNFELLPFAAQARLALNNQYRLSRTLTTFHTGVLTTAWNSGDMPTNTAWYIYAKAVATEKSVTPGGAGLSVYSVATRALAGANIVGLDLISSIGSSVGYDLSVVSSGSSILVQVKDAGAVDTNWCVYLEILEATSR